VSLPEVTSIGYSAFAYCTALQSVSLPEVTSIDSGAFYNCTALQSVSLPKATSIGTHAFGRTGSTALTITLGSTVPSVGVDMFSNVAGTKNVTVKRPSNAAAGYGSSPTDTTSNNWGNAFRGKGWNGTTYGTGTVNSYITLTITNS
jgi:hypothetical protein